MPCAPKKCAEPVVASVLARVSASIQTPTVAICTCGCDSVAAVMPLGRVGTSVRGPGRASRAVGHDGAATVRKRCQRGPGKGRRVDTYWRYFLLYAASTQRT